MSLKGIKIINGIDQNKCAGLMATITKHGGSYFVASLTQLLVTSPLTLLTQVLQIKIELKFLPVEFHFKNRK